MNPPGAFAVRAGDFEAIPILDEVASSWSFRYATSLSLSRRSASSASRSFCRADQVKSRFSHIQAKMGFGDYLDFTGKELLPLLAFIVARALGGDVDSCSSTKIHAWSLTGWCSQILALLHFLFVILLQLTLVVILSKRKSKTVMTDDIDIHSSTLGLQGSLARSTDEGKMFNAASQSSMQKSNQKPPFHCEVGRYWLEILTRDIGEAANAIRPDHAASK